MASTPNAATGHRILIIDDEAGIRESLETLLTLEGYIVDSAPDGEVGLDILEQRSYDLVLLDLALPGQNGIEIVGRIREHEHELPVIMITAYGTVDNVVDTIRAGAQNLKTWDNESCLPTFLRIARFRVEKRMFSSSALSSSATTNTSSKSETMLRIFV